MPFSIDEKKEYIFSLRNFEHDKTNEVVEEIDLELNLCIKNIFKSEIGRYNENKDDTEMFLFCENHENPEDQSDFWISKNRWIYAKDTEEYRAWITYGCTQEYDMIYYPWTDVFTGKAADIKSAVNVDFDYRILGFQDIQAWIDFFNKEFNYLELSKKGFRIHKERSGPKAHGPIENQSIFCEFEISCIELYEAYPDSNKIIQCFNPLKQSLRRVLSNLDSVERFINDAINYKY